LNKYIDIRGADIQTTSLDDIDPDIIPLLPQFYINKEKEIDQLISANSERDTEQQLQLLHKMKGSLNLYGFSEMANHCEQISALLKLDFESESIQKELTQLKTTLLKNKQALNIHINNEGNDD